MNPAARPAPPHQAPPGPAPAAPAPPGLVGRGLQCAAGLVALALAAGLVAGQVWRSPPDAGATASATSGHHGAPAAAEGASAQAGHAQDDAPAPGTTTGADGHVVHDHGDLQVTVMLGADGSTEVGGPVRPGAWVTLVNHTTTDQVIATADGSLEVDVPLRRLVTTQAPAGPGAYRLVSTTDDTVVAELVVTEETSPPSG